MCSVTVACVVVWVNAAKGDSAFLGKLVYPLEVCLFPLLRKIYRDESFRNGDLVFYAMSILLAMAIFALVLLLSHLAAMRPFLLIASGIADVASFPLGFLWLRTFYHISATVASWLLLEMVACAVAAVFYIYRRRSVPQVSSILLLAAHFGLWGWVNHTYDGLIGLGLSYGFWSMTFLGSTVHRFAFLLLGFFATLSWAAYVSRASESSVLYGSDPRVPSAGSPA